MSIGNNFLHSNVDNVLNAHIISDTVGEGLAPPVLKLLPFGDCIKEQINNLEIRYENVKIDNYVI